MSTAVIEDGWKSCLARILREYTAIIDQGRAVLSKRGLGAAWGATVKPTWTGTPPITLNVRPSRRTRAPGWTRRVNEPS